MLASARPGTIVRIVKFLWELVFSRYQFKEALMSLSCRHAKANATLTPQLSWT